MIKEITLFHDVKELEELTGLKGKALYEAGFDTDDLDGGIRVKDSDVLTHTPNYRVIRQLTGAPLVESDDVGIENIIESAMAKYCVGYDVVEYKGYLYYEVHH